MIIKLFRGQIIQEIVKYYLCKQNDAYIIYNGIKTCKDSDAKPSRFKLIKIKVKIEKSTCQIKV